MDKVFFFDVGGTLIRTARPVGYYYAEMASHYGLRADAELLQEGFKKAWKELKPRDPVQGQRIQDDKGWWKSLVRLAWSQQTLPEAFPFDDYFEELYRCFERPEVWRLFPEVEQTLHRLKKRGARLGILSNWDRRLRTILRGLEISDYFEDMIISSEVGVEKPHGKIFEIAQKRFNIEASQAVLVGDDPEFDQVGALAVGWQVVLVKRPFLDLAGALEIWNENRQS
jgi:putative hydrolase of the HAD superfamily